eukprot:TRINITY_DN22097_c0_g2_i3.p2 TRINITY_DN22097_c0_g2~~TRINITY_DN22097_c0_g2_i3.p2  ORF type:complete len:279 (+),score=-1.94 TRINITY_DN22097_c0_g2_i3:314-1150(+)
MPKYKAQQREKRSSNATRSTRPRAPKLCVLRQKVQRISVTYATQTQLTISSYYLALLLIIPGRSRIQKSHAKFQGNRRKKNTFNMSEMSDMRKCKQISRSFIYLDRPTTTIHLCIVRSYNSKLGSTISTTQELNVYVITTSTNQNCFKSNVVVAIIIATIISSREKEKLIFGFLFFLCGNKNNTQRYHSLIVHEKFNSQSPTTKLTSRQNEQKIKEKRGKKGKAAYYCRQRMKNTSSKLAGREEWRGREKGRNVLVPYQILREQIVKRLLKLRVFFPR